MSSSEENSAGSQSVDSYSRSTRKTTMQSAHGSGEAPVSEIDRTSMQSSTPTSSKSGPRS